MPEMQQVIKSVEETTMTDEFDHNNTSNLKKLLRPGEVARILDVSTDRIYQLVREGILPAVRIGRQVRICEQKLISWMDDGGNSLQKSIN